MSEQSLKLEANSSQEEIQRSSSGSWHNAVEKKKKKASNEKEKRKQHDDSTSEKSSNEDNTKGRKKHRLSWTNELHNLFVEAVQALGLENAAPKAIKNMMGVSYVTTDHIKSHLQKYRMQMKKSDDIISSSSAIVSREQEAEKKTKKRKNQTKSGKDNTKQPKTSEDKKSVESIEPAQNITSCSASSTGQSSSNSIGFNNWMQASNSGSSSSTTTIPFTIGVEQHISEKENEQQHNEASNSNFSFLKKVFTHSAESFLFDNTNSQSSFLIPSLSNLAAEELTSNHLSVFADSNAKDNLNLSSHSLGFNTQSEKEFVTSSIKESEKNQCRQGGHQTMPQQTNQNHNGDHAGQNVQTTQATSFLEQYSSLLFDMCRTDEEIRQLFLEAKHLAKSDDHFIFILHGYRLGVLSGLRMAKQQHK